MAEDVLKPLSIILTCYYAEDIVEPALQMIASQTRIQDIKVIMVNDCSPYTKNEYETLRNKYGKILDLQYVKTEKNCGPGIARNVGLQYADTDFVMFHDDDDVLTSDYIIEKMLHQAERVKLESVACIKAGMCLSWSWETFKKDIPASQNSSLQGVLFNNQFIKAEHIQFNPILSYKEEDAVFALEFFIKASLKGLKEICLEDDIAYERRYSNNHISLTANASDQTIALSMLTMLGESVHFLQTLDWTPQLYDILAEKQHQIYASLPSLFETIRKTSIEVGISSKNYHILLLELGNVLYFLSTVPLDKNDEQIAQRREQWSHIIDNPEITWFDFTSHYRNQLEEIKHFIIQG